MSQLSNVIDENYASFLTNVKSKIVSTRIRIAKSACKEQIELYWWLGEHIVQAQEKHGWGKSVVELLAQDLKHAFPGATHGFSVRNLWDMRRFYLSYRDHSNLRQLVAEIPWGQNLTILNKVKDLKAREYYITTTSEMGWTRNVLTIQIDSQAYERQALAAKQNNFKQVLIEQFAEQADKTMKDVYMLDTLGLTEPVLEVRIEKSMVNKIKEVMLELGYGFTFIGNQYRIAAPGGSENFIDLLFYNRQLRCLVAMELKTGKFKPEYAGKINYYLNLLDDFVKHEWENPSIGIILCSQRNRIDVEYALRGINKPVGVSEFRLTKNLPEELSGKLPEVDTLKAQILKELNSE